MPSSGLSRWFPDRASRGGSFPRWVAGRRGAVCPEDEVGGFCRDLPWSRWHRFTSRRLHFASGKRGSCAHARSIDAPTVELPPRRRHDSVARAFGRLSQASAKAPVRVPKWVFRRELALTRDSEEATRGRRPSELHSVTDRTADPKVCRPGCWRRSDRCAWRPPWNVSVGRLLQSEVRR